MKINIIDKYYQEAIKNLTEEKLAKLSLWYKHISQLPLHLQIIYTIAILHQQVFNGGFHQYFFNGYGVFAYDTIKSLNIIGATKSAALLQKATLAINNEKVSEEDFREMVFFGKFKAISDFDDKLCDYLDILDNEYYDIEEDVEQLLTGYLEGIDKL